MDLIWDLKLLFLVEVGFHCWQPDRVGAPRLESRKKATASYGIALSWLRVKLLVAPYGLCDALLVAGLTWHAAPGIAPSKLHVTPLVAPNGCAPLVALVWPVVKLSVQLLPCSI
ncbi:hypothetical protein HAX54_016954 [Datura stramonium]|uniref:Uncharacterized protein n=1 Tax=Datura stramonium TaxID=4076 RepID=A0ABS8UMN2_DATST|nr:hypothetical protein [Datura stramonium]